MIVKPPRHDSTGGRRRTARGLQCSERKRNPTSHSIKRGGRKLLGNVILTWNRNFQAGPQSICEPGWKIKLGERGERLRATEQMRIRARSERVSAERH